jgi:hypothetical protein
MIWSMYNIQNDFKKRIKLITSGLLHKLSSPHYRYIRKMRRGDRLPLTQNGGVGQGLSETLQGSHAVSNLVPNWLVS